MRYDSKKYQDENTPYSFVKIGFGLAVAIVVILFLLSPQFANFFLSISRAANQSAHNEVLASFLAPRPTYTPLPTQTPLPTHTPLPTLTPRPTYTPFPTPTPIPMAFIIQQLETQAQLVVAQNKIALRDFHVGVDDRLCSHGADFWAQGTIEAGIDFATIKEDRVIYDSASESYELQLPSPEFTSCRIDYIRLHTNSFSLCNPDWDRVRMFAESQAMAVFLKESDEEGLLLEAADQSAEILGDFVRTLTGKPVNIVFGESAEKPTVSASCIPEVPGGWNYDTSRNVWQRSDS